MMIVATLNRKFELDRNVGETEVDQTDADQTDANPGTDYKDICWQDGRRIVELKH
jgi:hypothetical protein